MNNELGARTLKKEKRQVNKQFKKGGYRDGVKKEKRQDGDGLHTWCSTIGDRITWSP